MWHSVVLLPDFQIPYHDKRLVTALAAFVGEYRPASVVHVGDFLDSPETGRWSKGAAGEYAGTLQASFDAGHRVLKAFRAVYDGPITVKEGNHDLRTSRYVGQYAPALAGLRSLRYESLLRMDELDIEYSRDLVKVAPGWVVAHGHEGGLSSRPGETALKLAMRYGVSVACGHTHRAGLMPNSYGYGGKLKPIWGMEVGHAMDVKRAGYLGDGAANWQQAVGILHVSGSRVQPQLIPVTGGRFIVDGREYG